MPPPRRAPHPSSVKSRKGVKAGSAAAVVEQTIALRSLEEISYEKVRFRLPQVRLTD